MQLAIGLGGAVLGGVVGGLIPGVGPLLGAQLGFAGGAILGGVLFPTEIDAGGPSRDDVRLTSTATGRFIPICYGTVRVALQTIWAGEPVFVTSTEEAKGGPEVKTTSVFLSWLAGAVEGPAVAVTRIWFDGELIFDISESNLTGPAITPWIATLTSDTQVQNTVQFSEGAQIINVQQFGPIRVYLGGDDEPEEPMLLNDPRIGEAFAGNTEDFVPPMAGLVKVAFDSIPGDLVNNHFPQAEVEVMCAASPAR